MVRLFQTAQAYWCEYSSETKQCLRAPIPKLVYNLCRFPKEVLEFGIVKEVDSGFYVIGSEENFSWLVQKKESGAKGGSSNKINSLSKEAPLKRNEAVLDPRLSGSKRDASGTNPLTLTLTPSLTLALNNKESKGNANALTHEVKNHVAYFIGCYVKAFQQRYNTRPDLNGKRQGQIRAFVKGCENFEELCQLVQVYCQSDDPWFVKKMHDIQTFAENIGKVRVMMNNGVDSTKFVEQKAKEQFWDKIKLE